MSAARLNWSVAVLIFWLFAARAGGEENCYLALLSNQGETGQPQIFALLIKTGGANQADGRCQVETMRVSLLPSCNSRKDARDQLPAEEALADLATAHKSTHLTACGPYAIKKSFYDMVLSQTKSRDQRGAATFGGGMANHLNALDALSENARRWQAAREANRQVILRGLEPWLLPRDKAPDWLSERLQIRQHGIQIADPH